MGLLYLYLNLYKILITVHVQLTYAIIKKSSSSVQQIHTFPSPLAEYHRHILPFLKATQYPQRWTHIYTLTMSCQEEQ